MILYKTFPIKIDCTTGQSTINIQYNTINWPNGLLLRVEGSEEITDPKLICYLSSLRHGKTEERIESAGDMILENNLVFNLQNHFDKLTNTVKSWDPNEPTLCHKLEYDGDQPLQNFELKYKNFYL